MNSNQLDAVITPYSYKTVMELDSIDAPDAAAKSFHLPVTWTLEEHVLSAAVHIGATRTISSIYKGDRPAYGATTTNQFETSIKGAIAEIAVSILLDKAWGFSVGVYNSQPDVDQEEVRSTDNPDYRLHIKCRDNLALRFWFVKLDKLPQVTVVGWIRGQEAWDLSDKVGSRRCNPPEVWYIPTKYLKTYIPVLAKKWMRPKDQPELL